jgi:hypothetical protein
MIRAASLYAGALALAMPMIPVAGADGTLTIMGGCGDPSLRVDIPFDRDQAPANDGDCCDRLACHAACERQKRHQRRS